VDWVALVLHPGETVSAWGRLVRNAEGDWFEGPVPVPLVLAPWVRRPMCAVPVLRASFVDIAERHEYHGDVEGFATVTGTWTGSEIWVRHQVPAAQPDEDAPMYQDRPPRTLRFHWTRREAEEVRDHLLEHWDDWSIYSMGIIGDHVEARLTRILPGIAAWAATLPPGILALGPWLTPAAVPSEATRAARAVLSPGRRVQDPRNG
jgi:hypothetical protein